MVYKYFSFSLLFVFLSFTVKSQDYIPLLDSTKRWNMTRTIHNSKTYTYAARIEFIDTLINDKTYQKVVSDTTYPLTEEQKKGFLGYIREDTLTKRVYYTVLDTSEAPFYFEENEERLLYDFSIEVGDTVEVLATLECEVSGDGKSPLEVIKIDSIELINGAKRKRWILENINNGRRVSWIEGVGSQFGLYMSSCSFTVMHHYEYSLLCYYENEEHLYIEEGQDTCAVFETSNVNNYSLSESKFQLYPNPASQKVNVSIDSPNSNTPVQYTLLDVTGKTVLEGTLENNTIDVSTINAGYYSVIIELNQQFYAKPLVVE